GATREDHRLAAELAEREEISRTATQSARALEDELAHLRAAIAEAALQRDRRIRERVYQEEQIETLTKRRAEIEKEIEALNARLAFIETELGRLRELDARLNSESEQTIGALQSAEETHAQKLAQVGVAENEIETAR